MMSSGNDLNLNYGFRLLIFLSFVNQDQKEIFAFEGCVDLKVFTIRVLLKRNVFMLHSDLVFHLISSFLNFLNAH